MIAAVAQEHALSVIAAAADLASQTRWLFAFSWSSAVQMAAELSSLENLERCLSWQSGSTVLFLDQFL